MHRAERAVRTPCLRGSTGHIAPRFGVLLSLGLSACFSSYSPQPTADGGAELGVEAGPDLALLPEDAGVDAGFFPDGGPVTRRCELGESPQPPGPAPMPCDTDGPGDQDGDGFANAVDCNDCVPQINPGAFDVPGNGIDDDCDGRIDNPSCDVADAPTPAYAAAAAIGLCPVADGERWGLLDARMVRGDGEELTRDGHRVVRAFGVNTPPDGASMLLLSSGCPEPGAPGCVEDLPTPPEPHAPTFPQPGGVCQGLTPSPPPHDSAAIELTLRVPTNAAGYRIGSNFFTSEFPEYVCSAFNDIVVVLEERNRSGIWRNVAFDRDGNFVSVNNGLLEVCESQEAGRRYYPCQLGTGALSGTPFEERGASTGWICTDVPFEEPSEILRLRIAIWDTGDSLLSSTTLIDGFRWIPEAYTPTAR